MLWLPLARRTANAARAIIGLRILVAGRQARQAASWLLLRRRRARRLIGRLRRMPLLKLPRRLLELLGFRNYGRRPGNRGFAIGPCWSASILRGKLTDRRFVQWLLSRRRKHSRRRDPAGLSASWRNMPAGRWRKLLAAWQGMNCGRLIRRWCARWVLKRARQCRWRLLLGWPHRLFVRPRRRLAARARLGASWRDLPAGQWGKLLAAWQRTNCGRLVRRRCAWSILNRARQCWLGLLLGWPHRLFIRPRQRLAIRARQSLAGRQTG